MTRVVGSYNTEREAIEVIEDLKRQGYTADDVSVISKDKNESEKVTEETEVQTAEGAATGAVAGGALGGLGGVLAGIGALAIPGIGPIVAAGPIAAGLTGAAAGAGVGGMAGALIGMGIPEDEAKSYESDFNDGKILVMVEDDRNRDTDETGRNLTTGEGNNLTNEDRMTRTDTVGRKGPL